MHLRWQLCLLENTRLFPGAGQSPSWKGQGLQLVPSKYVHVVFTSWLLHSEKSGPLPQTSGFLRGRVQMRRHSAMEENRSGLRLHIIAGSICVETQLLVLRRYWYKRKNWWQKVYVSLVQLYPCDAPLEERGVPLWGKKFFFSSTAGCLSQTSFVNIVRLAIFHQDAVPCNGS